MTNLLKLTLFILVVFGCSNTKNNDENSEFIIAKEYGVFVKTNGHDVEYSYTFYNHSTGEILEEGTAQDSVIKFQVTSRVRSNHNSENHVSMNVTVDNPNEVEVFAIAKNDDIYLNYTNNVYATNLNELNKVNYSNEKGAFEDVIPLEKSIKFWTYLDHD